MFRRGVCVGEHQIRLTAVPVGKAGFSLSCKYFVHTTLPTHPPPAFFRALLKLLPGIRSSFPSVPCLFGFLMTNFCIAQNLLSLIGFLCSYWCFQYEISSKLFGSCQNKASWWFWIVGPLKARGWDWFICVCFNVEPDVRHSSQIKRKRALKEIWPPDVHKE